MANSSRSRRGTSPSFWRNHDGRQLMLAQACMPSVRVSPDPQVNRTKAIKSKLSNRFYILPLNLERSSS
jgi:hypothetical protein